VIFTRGRDLDSREKIVPERAGRDGRRKNDGCWKGDLGGKKRAFRKKKRRSVKKSGVENLKRESRVGGEPPKVNQSSQPLTKRRRRKWLPEREGERVNSCGGDVLIYRPTEPS